MGGTILFSGDVGKEGTDWERAGIFGVFTKFDVLFSWGSAEETVLFISFPI